MFQVFPCRRVAGQRACLVTPALLLVCVVLSACSLYSPATQRRSGQVELFRLDDAGVLQGSYADDPASPMLARRSLLGAFNDPIRYTDDILTIQVHGSYLAWVPKTLTRSRDIILFAEVWENAAAGYASQSLNSIVYVARNQLVPGKLNFEGNLAYGPTNFKGHPFKIKFTLMLLQKQTGQDADAAAAILQNLLSASAPAVGGVGISGAGPVGAGASLSLSLGSQAVAAIRQILRSQPDVEAFDFEITLLSDSPERLDATILDSSAPSASGADRAASGEFLALAKAAASQADVSAFDAAPWPIYDVAMLRAFLETAGETPRFRISPADLAAATQLRIDLDLARDRIASSLDRLSADPGANNPEARALIADLRGALVGGRFDPHRLRASIRVEIADVAESQRLENLVDAYADVLREIRALAGSLASDRIDAGRASGSSPDDPAVLRNPWHERMNWARFGFYALVETRSSLDSSSTSPGSFRRFDPGAYRFESGWLVNQADDSLLDANYLIFSITPGQLRQDAAYLALASSTSAALLTSLAQSRAADAAIRDSLRRLNQAVGFAGLELLDLRAELLAREIARSVEHHPQPASEFADRFARAWAFATLNVENDFPRDIPQDQVRARVDAIAAALTARWSRRLTHDRASATP